MWVEGTVTPAHFRFKSATGDLNKADNGMSSHKNADREYIGVIPCGDHLKAFIGGFDVFRGCSMP